MNLTNEEKALVLDLSRNPVFTGLLQKISTETKQVPKWKKDGDEAAKHHQWVNSSGFVGGIEFVLKLLRYDND